MCMQAHNHRGTKPVRGAGAAEPAVEGPHKRFTASEQTQHSSAPDRQRQVRISCQIEHARGWGQAAHPGPAQLAHQWIHLH